MILSYLQGFVACFLDVMYDFFKVPEEVFSARLFTPLSQKTDAFLRRLYSLFTHPCIYNTSMIIYRHAVRKS